MEEKPESGYIVWKKNLFFSKKEKAKTIKQNRVSDKADRQKDRYQDHHSIFLNLIKNQRFFHRFLTSLFGK